MQWLIYLQTLNIYLAHLIVDFAIISNIILRKPILMFLNVS